MLFGTTLKFTEIGKEKVKDMKLVRMSNMILSWRL